jgi:predicted phosphoribosyltransferase
MGKGTPLGVVGSGYPFRDRRDAGRQLARLLVQRLAPAASIATPAAQGDPVVLGLPRGGVVVAAEVAQTLQAPLDVLVVRKLGVPGQPELAMGAIAEGGIRVQHHDVLSSVGAGSADLAAAEARELPVLRERVEALRGGRPPLSVHGRHAIVVDDGIATGSTARAACLAVRAAGARRVVLAAPVAPRTAARELGDVADDVVVLAMPEPFLAVGHHYGRFDQVSDAEVARILGVTDR